MAHKPKPLTDEQKARYYANFKAAKKIRKERLKRYIKDAQVLNQLRP
jgi:hypothetical protein